MLAFELSRHYLATVTVLFSSGEKGEGGGREGGNMYFLSFPTTLQQ